MHSTDCMPNHTSINSLRRICHTSWGFSSKRGQPIFAWPQVNESSQAFVLTICVSPSAKWTSETAAASYLSLITNLNIVWAEKATSKRISGREGAGLCCLDTVMRLAQWDCFSAKIKHWRCQGIREGDVCLYLLRREVDRVKLGRAIHEINTQKHPQLCHPYPVRPTSVWFEHTPTESADKSIWRTGKGRQHTEYNSPAAFRTLITPILFVLIPPPPPIWCNCIYNHIVTPYVLCRPYSSQRCLKTLSMHHNLFER